MHALLLYIALPFSVATSAYVLLLVHLLLLSQYLIDNGLVAMKHMIKHSLLLSQHLVKYLSLQELGLIVLLAHVMLIQLHAIAVVLAKGVLHLIHVARAY